MEEEHVPGSAGADEPLDLDRLAAVARDLADVEHALGRLDAGTWGTCETCGEGIDAGELERAPAARTCAAHR